MPSLTSRCHVTIPLVIYSATGFMFFPVFQSLIYNKVCLQSQHETGINGTACLDRAITSKHQLLQTKANHVLLICTVAISFMAMLAAPILGSISDRKSRKLAMLMPFTGLILEDLTLILQAHYMHESSVYYLVLSELIFGVFGGYMSVFSTTFAFAAHLCKDDSERKSKTMALLEGCLGLGGTIGLLLTGKTLATFGFKNIFILFTALHIFCFVYILSLTDLTIKQTKEDNFDSPQTQSLWLSFKGYFTDSFRMIARKRQAEKPNLLILLLVAFGASYFVYMGSVHILFFYLKHQLGWDASTYGYLKGTLQGAATFMALIIYPLLKKANFKDTTLALIGLTSRMLGRLYLAVIWNTASTFGLIICDMFSRFGAAALRSLMSQQVDTFEQGKIFALVAILEGSTSLLASMVFNSLFPATLSFFPQLSYIILGLIMMLPIGCVFIVHRRKRFAKKPNEIPLQQCLDEEFATSENIPKCIDELPNEEEIY